MVDTSILIDHFRKTDKTKTEWIQLVRYDYSFALENTIDTMLKQINMKIKTFLLIYLFTSTTLNAQNFEWAKTFGGINYDESYGFTIDAYGNCITTGRFNVVVDFNTGQGNTYLSSSGYEDIFIQKIDADGNFLWAKKIGGPLYDIGSDVCVDAMGNIYVSGSFFGTNVDFDPGAGTLPQSSNGEGDIFVLKLNSNGNLLWAKTFGGVGYDEARSICVDLSGNVYTAGSFRQTVDFDPGAGIFNLTAYNSASTQMEEIFIHKMDASGNFIWAKRIGETAFDIAYSITTDNLGHLYTTGTFIGNVDFDPGPGTSILSSTGGTNLFILKMDLNGNFIWAKSIVGSNIGPSCSSIVDAYGDLYTIGNFYGTIDLNPDVSSVFNLSTLGLSDGFIQKMDSDGNFIWAKSFGGGNYDALAAVVSDPSGDLYYTGNFSGTVDFDPGQGNIDLTASGSREAYICKMNPDGDLIWVRSFGGSSSEGGTGIALDVAGNIYTTGMFNEGTCDLDPGVGIASFYSQGNSDVFIQKLSQGTEVRGYVFIDANANGMMEIGEIPVEQHTLNYSGGNDIVITNNLGFFRAFPPLGLQTFNIQTPFYHTPTTPLSQTVNVTVNSIDTLYFGLQPFTNTNDLMVQIHPYTSPRPGFTRRYMVNYYNAGTTEMSNVQLKFLKNPADSFETASGIYSIDNDTLIWNIGTLPSLTTGNVLVTITLTTLANIGDLIQTEAWISPSANDTTPSNNWVFLNEPVVGSYDPNDKSVIPENTLEFENVPLEYTIRFQNTGNYPADFVVIKDTLDSQLDLSTFQMITTTHPYHLEIVNRIATWTFPNINLPDSISNEPESHGFLKFKVNRNQGLGVGTQIFNNAQIYFDYNAPINTNTCIFSIESILTTEALGSNLIVNVYPNPSTEIIHLSLNHEVHNVEVTLTDLLGKVHFSGNYNKLSNTEIEIQNPSGMYFLTLKTANRIYSKKLIKQ